MNANQTNLIGLDSLNVFLAMLLDVVQVQYMFH